jgi:hypothetical protein
MRHRCESSDSELIRGIYKGASPPCSFQAQDRILELKEQISLMDEAPLRIK